jgi:hypothetical protein
MDDRNKLATQEILRGICFLSAQCDGANSIDGAGFNKNDAYTGHSFAQKIKQDDYIFTGKQIAFMARLCNKYRRQLEAAGFDLNLIKEFDLEKESLKKKEKLPEFMLVQCNVQRVNPKSILAIVGNNQDAWIPRSAIQEQEYYLNEESILHVATWVVKNNKIPLLRIKREEQPNFSSNV